MIYEGQVKGRLAQLVRASRSHREGHWFESSIAHGMCGKLKIIKESRANILETKMHLKGAIFVYKEWEVRC